MNQHQKAVDSEESIQQKSGKRAGEKIRIILPIILVIVLSGICSRFFYQFMLIQGKSMEPAYHHLQIVMLDKIHREYHSGDVIAFRCEKLNSVLVKRIVAGPEDIARIREGTLYVNDLPSLVYQAGDFDYAGLLDKPIHLEEGEYLVIGDNIPESKDSRYPEVGIVKENEIVGKVL